MHCQCISSLPTLTGDTAKTFNLITFNNHLQVKDKIPYNPL